MLSSYGFLPMILLPTRVKDTTSTIIDNIFTNNLDNIVNSGNIITDISDHYSQFITVKKNKNGYQNNYNLQKRLFNLL